MSLEVPDPPAPIPPKPLVFERSREIKIGSPRRYWILGIALQGVLAFREAISLLFPPNYRNLAAPTIVTIWLIGSITFIAILVKTARGHGRVEIVGPFIFDYDEDNNLRAKEELKTIVALWEKSDPNNPNEKIYFFEFANGKIMYFPSTSINSSKLKTIVEQWSKQKFEHLSLANDETRALIQSSSST